MLLNTGHIKSWGSNTYNQLGIDSASTEEVFLPTEGLLDDLKMIACGYEHTLFLDKNGDLYGCGKNEKK